MMKLTSVLTVLTLLCLPSIGEAGIRPTGISKELAIARKNGASKEELKKLKKELMDKLMTARAAGVSFSAIKEATEKGAKLEDIKAKVNQNNLMKFKKKGLFKKKEASLSSILFPGASPEEYSIGSPIDIIVGTVDSFQTGLPLLYYDLPVCEPPNTRVMGRKRKNLGQRLAGKAVDQLSPFNVKVLENVGCTLVCNEPIYFRTRDITKMRKLISRQYKVNLSLDGLPLQVQKNLSGTVARGYPLGARVIDEASDITEYVYNNHVRFNILYNEDEASTGHVRIVGFNAQPVSIDHDISDIKKTCSPDQRLVTKKSSLLYLNILKQHGRERPVYYSYEVNWERSDTAWTDRWDIYLLGRVDDTNAHHMSLINSIMVVVFLACVVAVILIRSLRKDIAVYNEIDVDLEDEKEETGWKLIHGDVFRPPSTYPMVLSVMVGTGCQIAFAALSTLVMSQTHLINPMMKGRALSNIITMYVLSGIVSGYVSARIFKFFGGKNWKLNTIYTSAGFPGVLMGMFLSLNLFLTFYGSAKSVRIFTILSAFFLWICVATPMVCVGSFIGFKRDAISVPTRTNQIARVIPPTNSFLRSPIGSLFVGVLPFSTICIEIYFLMGAIWLHQYYFLMGYLLMITILVGVTTALLSMVMSYVRLCSEDHRWMWKSFIDGASCGLWLFVYSIWFIIFRLNFKGLMPILVYFTYMAMISLSVSLYCGGVSFLSTLWFTRKIYSTVKLD